MGEQIPVIGRAIVNVNYKKESKKLPLLIVKRKGQNLLGRDWLNKLQLDWKDIFSVVGSDNQSSDLNVILEANKEIFKDELGTLDNYPIPKTEDLYATLGGGQEYTKLDLNQAYQQIELDEDSKRYVTINTHKGLFRYNRLPYGVASSPGIFQRTLENVVQGIANVFVRVDDILITGKTREEHLNTLSKRRIIPFLRRRVAIIFGIKKISSIFVWTSRYNHNRSQAAHRFREDKPIPTMAASRIQSWALTLTAYEYTIIYKEGSLNGNADGLSRLPLKTNTEKTPTPGDTILLMEHLATTPVDAKQIQKWTRKDTILSMVLRYILNEGPSKCPREDI
ncbi:uncharacterized protein [Mytilus edulis]|uniref:uncharacterized protein n=1 Tax=Mytilus edulis TaxID=6550 RepID=UPI0039EF4FA6